MLRHDVYYVRPEDVREGRLTLQKDEAHHLLQVMRKSRHDLFSAVDGRGMAYDCQIEEADKSGITAKILKKTRNTNEPVFQLTLAVALPKKDKFEWIIEKGTEIGAVNFVPLLTQRTMRDASSVKVQRCQKILVSAMKQCHRSVLPGLEQPMDLSAVCEKAARYDVKWLAHEREADNVSADSPGHGMKTGILCIGPEGGFTDEEVAAAREAGIDIIGLGPRRLRTETAALTAAALMMNRMGEI